MKRDDIIIVGALATIFCVGVPLFAADIYKMNPHTGKLDNTGPVSQVMFNRLTSLAKMTFKGYSGPPGYTPHLGVDYFDGRTIPALFGNISGGQGHAYDQTGLNPTPAPTAYKSQLWLNGTRITPLRQAWVATGHLAGSGTGSSFTPSIHFNYSSNWGARIVLYQTYSTTAGYGGKRYHVTTIFPAITRKGDTGATGPQGADATVTRTAVFNVMSSGSKLSNTTWQYRPFSNLSTNWLTAYRDYAGNVRQKINGHGYTDFLSANGADVVRIMTDGTLMLMKSGVLRLHLKDDGSITHYRNGQQVFNVYSTGRWRGAEGYSSSALKQIPYVTPGGFRGYTTMRTGGAGGAYPGGSVNGEFQYRASATTFGSAALLRYTAVARSGSTVTQAGIINGANLPLVIYNAARRVVFAVRSSGAVIIGGS